MSVCVTIQPDNTLLVDAVAQPPSCPYILYTGNEYTTIKGFNELFSIYFDFDSLFFAEMFSAYMVTFITGHVIARVVSRLR